MLDRTRRTNRRQLIWGGLGLGLGALAATTLGACAQPAPTATSVPPTQNPGGAPTTAPAAATPAPKAAAPVDLNLIFCLHYGTDVDKKIFPPAYELFSKQNDGKIVVKETILPHGNEYYVKILTLIAAGLPPDTAYTHMVQGLPRFAGQGVIVPVDDYIKTDKSLDFDDLIPAVYQVMQHPQGKTNYSLPYSWMPMYVFYNKKVFQPLGEKLPEEYQKEGKWTWETFTDVGRRLTQGEGATKTFGLEQVTNALDYLHFIARGYGTDLWDEPMDRTLLGEPLAVEALDLWASWAYKHKMAPTAAELPGLPGGWAGGRRAFRFGIKGNVPAAINGVNQGLIDPGTIVLPSGPKGKFGRPSANALCIFRASKNQEAAWKLMAFMTQKEFQDLQNVTGATAPVRKSYMNGPDYVKSLQPWESLQVIAESTDIAKSLRFATTHSDIQAAFAAEYDTVLLGRQSYQEAATKFVPKIDALLKKAQEG